MFILSIALTLHLLSAVVWVGGMFAAYLCLRPAAGPLEPPQRDRLRLRSSWACHTFFPLMDVNHTFFGRAEYDLARRDEGWVIVKKKTILENDRIPLPIDVYCL